MAKKEVYVIRDRVAMEGSDLIVAKNDAVAVRLLRGFCAKGAVSPSDFELLHVGSYDPETCRLEAIDFHLVGEPKEMNGVESA